MRWSCPHCGTLLELAEERIGSGWSFSRCYRCGGFALIRKAELSVIKVDKAPAGEKILLPESSSDPRHALSLTAAQNYSKLVAAASGPSIPPPPPGTGRPPTFSRVELPLRTPIPQPALQPALPPEPALSRLPQPLPEIAQTAPPASAPATSAPPLPWSARLQGRVLYGAIGLASLATLGSGSYLILESRALFARAKTPATHTDAIATSNAAPVAEIPRALAPPPGPSDDVIRPPRPSGENAQAPAQAPTAREPLPDAGLWVRLRRPGARLYSGPGLGYAPIGLADPVLAYRVADWTDRWFKLSLDETSRQALLAYNSASPATRARTAPIGTAVWISNDLVTPSPAP